MRRPEDAQDKARRPKPLVDEVAEAVERRRRDAELEEDELADRRARAARTK